MMKLSKKRVARLKERVLEIGLDWPFGLEREDFHLLDYEKKTGLTFSEAVDLSPDNFNEHILKNNNVRDRIQSIRKRTNRHSQELHAD